MLSSDTFKKIDKAILKFSLFNESIRRSEESRGVREAENDDGEDVRVLSSSNSDDGEYSDDDYDGGGVNDNNGGNNNVDGGTYSLECHIQELSLTSSQHYGVGYGYSHRPQLERSASTGTDFSTFHRDDANDDFVPHRNSI